MQRDQLLWAKKAALYEDIAAVMVDKAGSHEVPLPITQEDRNHLVTRAKAIERLIDPASLYATWRVSNHLVNYQFALAEFLRAPGDWPQREAHVLARQDRDLRRAMSDDLQGVIRRWALADRLAFFNPMQQLRFWMFARRARRLGEEVHDPR